MKLYKYQEDIYNIVKDKKAFALYMEAGTGKTIISQKCFDTNGTETLLVVCLASKVREWYDDCIDYYGNKYSIIALNQGYKKNIKLLESKYNIYIISFESLLLLEKNYHKTKKEYLQINDSWTIIIDEVQVIKNYKSKISKTMHRLGAKTKYKIILTGTPQNKGYIDYFSQYKFLGIFDSVTNFKNKFCVEQLVRYGAGIAFKSIVAYQNTDELDKIINDNAVFFKRQREINEIPIQKYINFNRSKVYLPLLKTRVFEDIACVNGGVLRLRARQLCGGAINQYRVDSEKIAWITEFIENTEGKIVIFHNFTEECNLLSEIVNKLKRPLSVYTGQKKDIDNFNNKDNAVLLVNYQSGGVGINWIRIANIGVFWTPPESYMAFEQARKRIDRLGQTSRPMFYCLRTLKTVEEDIYKSIENKEDYDQRKFDTYLERINNE